VTATPFRKHQQVSMRLGSRLHLFVDKRRHEVLDGHHYVTPSPFVRHQRISGRTYRPLSSWVEEHDLGEVLYASVDVVLSPHDVAVPDLLYVSKERAGIITEKNIQGPPDLVVEIISPSTRLRDEGIKLQRYGVLGVDEYWMVYPDRRVIRTYRREGDRLRLAADLSAAAGDALSTPLLPGLEIPLAEVFV
jgi:Uma2 family endonuclease